MEQIYMIEILMESVSVFKPKEGEPDENTNKKYTITVRFGPRTEFVIKEGLLGSSGSVNEKEETDTLTDAKRTMRTRTIRCGKSYIFPSYPDVIIQILDKFPLEILVWTDDEKEEREFVGTGIMKWDKRFYNMLKENTDPTIESKTASVRQKTPLMDEQCCGRVGYITFVLRLTPLGDSIVTTFQELPKNENEFVFTTDRSPSLFHCKRTQGEDLNFIMIGSMYHSAGMEDPEELEKIEEAKRAKREEMLLCRPDDNCKTDDPPLILCQRSNPSQEPKINKIKMGEIKGPCGNVNCTLAQKIKKYLRNTENYKKEAKADPPKGKKDGNNKLCGECGCDRGPTWHRKSCPEFTASLVSQMGLTTCAGCGGLSKPGETCDDTSPENPDSGTRLATSENDNNCVCGPPKDDKPKCAAFDCLCVVETVNRETRKSHKPFCPSYKHKHTCPAGKVKDESDETKDSSQEEEKEDPVLPPIKLGPCPVLGKPCSYPDAFNRLVNPPKDPMEIPMPPSYSEAGKICCRKEFDRVKAFLTDMMKEDVEDDFRCLNAIESFNEGASCCQKKSNPRNNDEQRKNCTDSEKNKPMK